MSLKYTDIADKIKVAAETEVLVAGAGIAGISAALAAARHGKKVIMLDKAFAAGGMATLGLIAIYLPLCDGCGHQVSFGLAEELLKLSVQYGYDGEYPGAWLNGGSIEERAKQRFKIQFNPQLFALSAEKLLKETGVQILYGTYAVECVTKGSKITHVIVENKSGRTAIAVESVIDCTGDADICHFSGAPTVLKQGGNGLASWYYYNNDSGVHLKMFGLADVIPDKANSDFTNGSSVPDDQKTESLDSNYRFSGVDGYELSDAVLRGHEKMLEDILSLKKKDPSVMPVTMSTIPLVRMSRRLDGVCVLHTDCDHKKLDDSIGMTGDWTKKGPVYEIPFGALHCKEISNLLAAGRDISTTDDMWNVTRVIPPCAVTGQAAGTAASITDDFNNIDIGTLQRILVQDGVKLHMD